MTKDKPWVCICGETDIEKHDIGMVIAHEFGTTMQEGRDILVRLRDRLGIETEDSDKILPKETL